LGGRTGSGKTIELKKMPNAIDLEGLANHRGSSFGQRITPQTSQIDFENNLTYELIQKIEEGFKHLVFEDEGKHVGTVFMPDSFLSIMSEAPLVVLDTPMEERIDITLNEYVIEAQKSYESAGFENPLGAWQQSIENAMFRIIRRLGNQKHGELTKIFEAALQKQQDDGSFDGYREWVEYLLVQYYDPMYDYQIQKRSEKVAFRGEAAEIQEYIKNHIEQS
jgi:tRNA 2-selenouridine synthase